MSPAVLALVLIVWLSVALAAVRFFKTLDRDFFRVSAAPLVAGIVAGVLIRVLDFTPAMRPVLSGILVTLAALYARLTGEESEPADGMLLGAASGGAAALPLVINGDWELAAFAMCVVAGAIAGYGVTFAAFHVADKLRQFAIDLVTAVIAMAGAYVVAALPRLGLTGAHTAIAVTIAIPLLAMATVFKQWPDIRAELRHEASLGFMSDSDVRATAHPFLRFGRAGWTDAHAHREFVRVANRIALRKRQQRNRPDDMARLYQLEIIKLRMQLQEMSKIDRDTTLRRRRGHGHDDELPSDTMARQ